jgi:hypothetical protein
MGILDHADDARQHGVPGRLGGLHGERSVAVDRAGVNLRAGHLLDWDALAGDGRLIDDAGAGNDPPIQRDALAGRNDETMK